MAVVVVCFIYLRSTIFAFFVSKEEEEKKSFKVCSTLEREREEKKKLERRSFRCALTEKRYCMYFQQ